MSDVVSLSSLNQATSGSLYLDHTRATSEAAVNDARSSTGSDDAQGDSIVLSGAAGLVQQALSAGSDARAARVEQLKQQIQSGQYTVDAAAVGSAIVNAGITGD